MKIRVNQQIVGSCDNRFNDKMWTDGSGDSRIRKSKRTNKRFATFKAELKKTFVLVIALGLITGFIYLRLAGI